MEGGVTYLALRCFSCQMFQVNRKTKSGKWKCSVCGGGQSVVKIWGRGDRAKDVRGLVMDLNAAAGRGEDLTATLRKTSVTAGSTALPSPHQTRDARGDAVPASFGRGGDPHGRAALLAGSGTALQPRRFAEGMDKPRRFAEGMAEPRRFAEGMASAWPVDTRQAPFGKLAPLGFTSARDRSGPDSFGSRAGERRDGCGMGGSVWNERQNVDYADGALSGSTPTGGYRAPERVGTQPFREQASPRHSTIEATDRGSKASRWGAFASSGRGVDRVEKRCGQAEFGQEMEGDPSFVTSLPETAAPSTQRRGGPYNEQGKKRALASTSASICRGAARDIKSGRRMGQIHAASGCTPLVGQAPESDQQQQTGRGNWLGTSRGEADVCGGRREGGGGSSGARVFVGELDKNAHFSGSRVSGEKGSTGVGGGKAKSSRWSNFV